MLAPMVVGVVVFQYAPLVNVFLSSLQRLDPFTREPQGGLTLANYETMFADPDFVHAVFNSVGYILLTLCLEIPLALLLAVLINAHLPSSRFLRAAVIAAMAVSETVGALVWSQIYQPGFGLLNATLEMFGLPAQPLLTSPQQALTAVVVMSVWRGVGLPMLIFLAGLQAIPSEVYEAAKLDGVGPVRTVLSITLPLLKPSLVVAIFMSTLAGARIFTPVSVMTGGGPEGSTANLIYYSYQQAFSFQAFGTAAAAAIVMLVILVAISLLQTRLLRSES